MNPIKLTKTQSVKLLEMCKILFISSFLPSIKDNMVYIWQPDLKPLSSERERRIEIHWFEFCMTYLPIEMYRYAMHQCGVQPKKAMEIITNNLLAFEDFDRYYINPIDYLYEEFKKLKQNATTRTNRITQI